MESRDEVLRSASPFGPIDAVLVEMNSGGTTSFGYEVHVVERGKQAPRRGEAAFLYAASRSDNAYGANLRWLGPTDLAVEYLGAQIAKLSKPEVEVGGSIVRVVFRPGINDPRAPAGGMLYNLERAHGTR